MGSTGVQRKWQEIAEMTARSVMTDSVVSVSPEASLLDVLRLFVEEDIHGAPVIGEDGELAGVISTSDLLRAEEDEHDTASAAADYLRDLLEFSVPDSSGALTDFQDRLAQRIVADVMTTSFASVSSDAPVAQVARCLRENRIHRVWVVDQGRLGGVVSALDLMAVVERAGAEG
jgi:CBS domain-containing protein